MKIDFKYDKEKDIWCLLNKGKSSNNSQNATKVYQELVRRYREDPTEEDASKFVDEYLQENSIDVKLCTDRFQSQWAEIAQEYTRRAENIFKVSLPEGVSAFLTVNNRCPYNIKENYFYVSMSTYAPVVGTIMHELWHFYTWYGLGSHEQDRLGKERYNELKEALTVLLNVECNDLFPKGVVDTGYSQHQELRTKALELWNENKDVKELWRYLISL